MGSAAASLDVLRAWGIKTPKSRAKPSSALPQTIAALHQYGLLTEYKRGDGRIAPSDLAQRILISPGNTAEQEALRSAALKPRIFAEIWQELQRDRPRLIHTLTTAREVAGRAPFTPKGAVQVLRIFRETFQYAELIYQHHLEAIESSLATASSQPASSFDDPKISNISLFRPFTSKQFTESFEGWTEEPLTDEAGDLILIRYRGKPNRKRYEFIRDYLDLKIKRLEPDS